MILAPESEAGRGAAGFFCLLLIKTGIAKLDETLDEAGKQGLVGAWHELLK